MTSFDEFFSFPKNVKFLDSLFADSSIQFTYDCEVIINQPKPRITDNEADHGASGGEKHQNKSKVKLPWDFNFNEVKNSDYLK